MDDSIIERLNKGKKIFTSISIDEALLERLTKFREKKKIRKLSPLINEVLWEWINKIDREDKL